MFFEAVINKTKEYMFINSIQFNIFVHYKGMTITANKLFIVNKM